MIDKKTGRNDKCPCGSGKKYKKCCINKQLAIDDSNKLEDPITPPNVYQLLILKFFQEKHFDLQKEKNILENKVFDSLADLSKPPIDVIVDFIKCCENEIKTITTKYCIYELLYWSRRFGPHNIFNVSELSVMLYREIQALSIYKYGQHKCDLSIDETNGSTFPKMIEEYNNLDYLECIEKINKESLPKDLVQILSDVVRIEILSYIYLRATQNYRIGNKKGTIVIDKPTKKIHTYTDDELGYLIDLYDERLIKTNIFSTTGSYVNTSNLISNDGFCPFFNLNVDHKKTMPLFIANNKSYEKLFKYRKEGIEVNSNYLMGMMSLKSIYDFLILFEEEFEQHYRFTLKNFIIFLGCLGYKISNDIISSVDSQIHIYNRAYIVANYNTDTFINTDIKIFAPIISKNIFNEINDSEINITDILDKFLLKKDNQNDIDLWTRGPKRILYQVSKNHMVLDYSSTGDIIKYIVKDITSTDGDIGNRRANYFEEMLEKEVKDIFGEDTWICRKELVTTKGKKEIDASFKIKDVLFIIEAKAVNESFGYDKGDLKALQFRENKMKQALKESNEKVQFIIDNIQELNNQIPKNIKYICPFVISSKPEYIWEKSEDLFISIDDNFPRILTIDDLKDFPKLNINKLMHKNWVVKVV